MTISGLNRIDLNRPPDYQCSDSVYSRRQKLALSTQSSRYRIPLMTEFDRSHSMTSKKTDTNKSTI